MSSQPKLKQMPAFLKRVAPLFIGVGLVLIVAQWPVTTRFGVNYHWSSKRIPLYEKAVNFFSRDFQARRLAREVMGPDADLRLRLLRLYRWSVENIKPIPEGFPVADDHLWNIIVRGYGAADQRAEVLALLASYAGCKAAMAEASLPDEPTGTLITWVRCPQESFVFDVNHNVVFLDADGKLLSVEQLRQRPEAARLATQGIAINGIAYARYAESYIQRSFNDRLLMRMDAQKPLRRLTLELSRSLGFARER